MLTVDKDKMTKSLSGDIKLNEIPQQLDNKNKLKTVYISAKTITQLATLFRFAQNALCTFPTPSLAPPPLSQSIGSMQSDTQAMEMSRNNVVENGASSWGGNQVEPIESTSTSSTSSEQGGNQANGVAPTASESRQQTTKAHTGQWKRPRPTYFSKFPCIL